MTPHSREEQKVGGKAVKLYFVSVSLRDKHIIVIESHAAGILADTN